MNYFHVIAKLNSSNGHSCIFSDLSNNELQSKFLSPYRKGKDFLSGNNLIRVSELSSVQIIATQETSEVEREVIQKESRAQIDEINRQSNSMMFISIGRGHSPEDIAEAGVDVTSDYLKGPPGYANGRFSLSVGKGFLQWGISIITGLAVAGIAKWLGWV
jgi:hypothetical protein